MSELHAASDSKITSAFESISEDVRSFYSGLSIVYLENPDAFTFLQQVVSQHRPCILTGMLESWPALHKWQDLEYLMAEISLRHSLYSPGSILAPPLKTGILMLGIRLLARTSSGSEPTSTFSPPSPAEPLPFP